MTRHKDDAYMTPPPLAKFCVELLRHDYGGEGQPPRPHLTYEPACGTGNFVRALLAELPQAQCYPSDIAPNAGAGLLHFKAGPFLGDEPAPWAHRGPFDLVFGNPPFRIAEAFVRRSLTLVHDGGLVGQLLRVGFLSSKTRLPLWKEHPARKVWILAERPSFTGDGKTDSYTYCWIVWRKGFTGPTELEVVSWK